MALNDLFVVTLTMGVDGGLMKLPFSYRSANASLLASSVDLREAFFDDVIPLIAGVVVSLTQFSRIDTLNLFDPADFDEYIYPSPAFGTRTGQSLPFFNAAAFKSQKPEAGQRPARKRFGYLSESDVQGQGLQDVSGYFAALDALAAQLGTNLTRLTGTEYEPQIIKRIKYTTPSGKDAYRFPNSPEEAEDGYFPAINWTWSNIVTSQITRKFGRGI